MKIFDLVAIKNSHPILDVVGPDVKLRRSGKTYVGLCPFHQHTSNTPSFAIYPDNNTWRCYGLCAEGGDVIKYVMKRDSCDFKAACEKLGGQTTDVPARKHEDSQPVIDVAPSAEWQSMGGQLVKRSQAVLWSEDGEKAKAYLHEQRLLTDYTIDRWGIGYIPEDCHMPFEDWGLEPNPDQPKGVWLPRGIVIPTFDAYGHLWAIHVRRATGEPKYPHVAGSKKSLWGTQNIDRRCVFMWGGEFDAMLAEQEGAHAGGHCSPTTGEGSQWSSTWASYMLYADTVIVSYDNDEAGQKGAWKNIMAATSRAVMAPALPDGMKDLTDYARAGGNVRQWILNLREKFLSKQDDPEQLWKRIEANYESRLDHPDYFKDLEIDFALSAGGD